MGLILATTLRSGFGGSGLGGSALVSTGGGGGGSRRRTSTSSVVDIECAGGGGKYTSTSAITACATSAQNEAIRSSLENKTTPYCEASILSANFLTPSVLTRSTMCTTSPYAMLLSAAMMACTSFDFASISGIIARTLVSSVSSPLA